MKKIAAIIMALALCGILAVASFADISDTEPMKSYTRTFIPYFNGGCGIWAGLKADNYDFANHTGSDLADGAYGNFKPTTEFNTFFITFIGGDYGDKGNDINGFCYVGQGDYTGEQMKDIVSIWVNSAGTGSWNSWTPVEIVSVDVEATNNLPVYVFWFKEVVKTDSILVHFSTAYDSTGYNVGIKSQVNGNDWARLVYEPSKLPAEEDDTPISGSTDTSDYTVAVVVAAAVAVLGTALVSKKVRG